MSPERHQRLMALFDEACALSPGARAGWLAGLRVSEPGLADELATLLDHDQVGGDFFDSQDGRLDVAALDVTQDCAPRVATDGETRIGSVIAGRYRLQAWLGSGASGHVYRAHDRSQDRTVAIKLLRPDLISDRRQVQRFRREFRAIARIEHPGCLAVFEEGVDGGQRFIAMEHVAGGNLSRMAAAPVPVRLAVLARLAVALDCVHARRIVHRDLKPANVLLAAGDPPQPKLADFGIVQLPDEGTRLTESGAVIGTIDYIAPEALTGRELDPRADLYALGCILFELWAGRPPFRGAPFERLRARLDRPAPRLCDAARELPDGLDDLVGQLLAREPEHRPQRAADVARALDAIGRRLTGAAALVDSAQLDASGFLYRPPLTGRAAPQAQLHAAIDGAHTGGGLVLITGAAGVGKSALVTAVGRERERAGQRCLTIQAREAAAGPFSPMSAALAAVERARGREVADGWRTRADTGRLDDGAAARRQLARALAKGLRALHRQRPVILVLEDLHHAGAGALALLDELVCELGTDGGERPAVIATARPAGRHALADAALAVTEIVLEPLDADAIAEIAAAMLATPRAALPPELIPHLWAASGGSPLLCQSALRAAVDSGRLRLATGGWTVGEDLIGPMDSAVGEVLRGRVAALTTATRRLLAVTALCDASFDVDLLCEVADVDEDAALDAIDEGLRAAVLRPATTDAGCDAYQLEHARLGEALAEQLDAAARARYHDAIGEALRARGASAAVLARCFVRGTEPVRALPLLREAGAAACEQGDHRSAAAHLGQALALVDSLDADAGEEVWRACSEARADALVRAGQVDDGIALFTELSARAAPRVVRARWLRKLGMARLRTADLAGGLESLQRALVLLGDGLPPGRRALHGRVVLDWLATLGRRALRRAAAARADLQERAILHRELGLMHRWIDVERAFGHLAAFRRLAHRLGLADYLIDAHAGAGFLQAILGWRRLATRSHERARRLALGRGDVHAESRLETVRGGIETVLTGDEDRARTHLDRGVVLAEQVGDRFLEGFACAMRGIGKAVLGRWRPAVDDFRRAERLAGELGVSWLETDAACSRAAIELLLGEVTSSERTARAVLGGDQRLVLPAFELLATEVLAVGAMCSGRYADAVRHFDHARAVCARHHLDGAWGMLSVLGHSEALLCLADERGAGAVPALCRRLRRNARTVRRTLGWMPLGRGFHVLLRGVHHARRGNERAARRLFARVRASRPSTSRHPLDLWMRTRLAIESHRLGDGGAGAELTEIDACYRELGLGGLAMALAHVRRVSGL